MAFTFLRSYQTDTAPPDEEEEDEMPMARSGSVRAFSHLPDSTEEEPEDAPPQVVVRGSGGMRPYSPMDEAADDSTSPASRDAEEETPSDDDASSLHAPQNRAPDTAEAAPISRRTSGLMMRPRPMPAEYARRQARGRLANSTPYGHARTDTEADAPPETPRLNDPDDQHNLPPETAPDAPASSATPPRGVGPTAPSSPQRLQQSRRDIAALQQQVRESNPPAQSGRPAAPPQAPAQVQHPVSSSGQNAAAAPQPSAAGGGDQGRQHPYKINEADENAEIVRTTNASAPPPRKGAKFGEHARSVINNALENSPTARAVLNKARELSGKDVVIHSTTTTNAQPYIGLDGTIHIYVNPNTLLPGTIAHETAHAIQNWHQQKAARANRAAGRAPTKDELAATSLQGRKELHGIAPVTYVDPNSKPEDDTSDNEPRSKSTENEAMRIANIVNAEISAAKVKAKMDAFKKSNPDKFNEMLKNPEEFAQSVAKSFWVEQSKVEAISHQDNKNVPMRESTLYGKDGALQHVLETLGYGVTAGHIKNATPLRARYAPPQ